MRSVLSSRVARWIALVIVVLAALAGIRAVTTPSALTVVAEFERTSGLYKGSDVKVLGVKVGKVVAVEPRGEVVRVTMEIDPDHPVPADAMAAVVAPSLVSGRYVQLAPAYTGGAKFADGDLITADRTAVPVEWDDIKDELTRLSQALAPRNGARDGALSGVIRSASGALEGNGTVMRDALGAMSEAADTLSGNRDNLFLTVRSLAAFIAALNDSGDQIEAFTRELASISGVLDDNSKSVRALLSQADRTALQVHRFVTENGDELDTSLAGLTSVGRQLADNQVNLANILHLAPTTVANFYNIYDPTAGTLTGRLAVGQTMGLSNTVCQAIFSAGGTLADCQKALGPLLDMFNIESLPVSVNPLNQPGSSNQADPGKKAPETSGDTSRPAGDDTLDELSRLLLGGSR